MLPIVINILLAIHVLVSLLIVLLVLMQRPKNEGLGAAFGGGMTENLFGAQTSNVLQTITRWLGGLFFVLALSLSYLYVKNTQKSNIQQRLQELRVAPVTSITPDAAAGDKVRDAVMKAIEEKQKGTPLSDETPAASGAASAPVKPGEPLPAPAAPAAPEAQPATPEKAPEKPADDAPAK